MGKRKGYEIRPCHVCGEPVNFVHWPDHPPKIWHWANPDGSHHVHLAGGRPRTYADQEREQNRHLRDILDLP